MASNERVSALERELAQIRQVVQVNEKILGEQVRPEPLPASLEKLTDLLRSARDLDTHGGKQSAEKLLGEAEAALRALRQWLAVTDLAISAFNLRTHLEKHPPERDLQQALIHYYLDKKPHVESDRDKLDFLLTDYFVADQGGLPPEPQKLHTALEGLLRGEAEKPLGSSSEVMAHELESLIARVEDFSDFDQLVQARMVERVRAIKANLGEEFYHPHVLATVIRFNVSFRSHFETLFHQQLTTMREETRAILREAEELVRLVETAYRARIQQEGQTTARSAPVETAAQIEPPSPMGRPLEVVDERPPIDRLARVVQEAPRERELKGIVSRLTRFIEKLPAEKAAADKIEVTLRAGKIELEAWEREAFSSAATRAAPESTRTIQYALGVIAWMEEELARYQQTQQHRYLWKTHLDLLSYAANRGLGLLGTILEHERSQASEPELAWLEHLLRTAHRLGVMLHRVAPVFEEPADM